MQTQIPPLSSTHPRRGQPLAGGQRQPAETATCDLRTHKRAIRYGRRRLLNVSKRTSAAQRLLDELDAELATSAAAAGRSLSWSAAERQIIALVADAMDRRVDLAAAYDQADDVKDRIKLSRELRLQEAAAARLLGKISTDVPAPESLRSVKARRAANVRWHGAD
jgi:hypothetical protein